MKLKQHFFTRLTSNFNNWKTPSGRDGKCTSNNGTLYEEIHGFGWEEWLFEEYHANKKNPDHICHGFIQAFNNKNKTAQIERLYLYTKVDKNKEGIKPGCYYVGYIDNVEKINPLPNEDKVVCEQLKSVGIDANSYNAMLPYAYNITFQVKDVHVVFPKVYCQLIKLEKGQYRFGMYDMNKHINFINSIRKYL
ncbi:MAG: hypothetical protein RL516_10 [Bacteroidota bacterium]|jgi:hypothetical protein